MLVLNGRAAISSEQGAHSWLGLAWIWRVQQCIGLLAAFCSLSANAPCLFWQKQPTDIVITMSTCRVAHMMWVLYLDMLLELLTAIEDLQHSQRPCQNTRLPMDHTCINAHLSASHLHLRMTLSSSSYLMPSTLWESAGEGRVMLLDLPCHEAALKLPSARACCIGHFLHMLLLHMCMAGVQLLPL